MNKAAMIALALGAVAAVAGAGPVAAQVVVGGSGQPSVEVNWSVIDRLGPAPTLAGMLKKDMPESVRPQPTAPGRAERVTFHPYKPAPAKTKPVAHKPAPAVRPVATKIEAEPVAAAPAAKSSPQPATPALPEPVVAKASSVPVAKTAPQPIAEPAKAPSAPEIALPTTPVIAKAEPAKVESPKAVPPPLPPVAVITPPPPPPPPPMAAIAPPPPAVAAPTPAVAPPPRIVEPEAKVASLPPAAAAPAPSAVSRGGDSLTIPFAAETARLPDGSRADLETLAARMEKDEGLSLQLLAYASGDDASASKARRLSLSRALEVRKFLMDLGVRSTRIEVRALGAKGDGAGSDRVDAVLVAR